MRQLLVDCADYYAHLVYHIYSQKTNRLSLAADQDTAKRKIQFVFACRETISHSYNHLFKNVFLQFAKKREEEETKIPQRV